jgi:hypothetical protein
MRILTDAAEGALLPLTPEGAWPPSGGAFLCCLDRRKKAASSAMQIIPRRVKRELASDNQPSCHFDDRTRPLAC